MREMAAEISQAATAMCKKATAANALNEKYFMGLTRIRPNQCAFKDAFFGSSSLEFNCGAVKIGHRWHFTGALRRNNLKLLDQVQAVSRLKHYSIRTEQAGQTPPSLFPQEFGWIDGHRS